MSCAVSSFSSACPADDRALHSFPTRRSSDLDQQRRREYFDWARRVVDGVRGAHAGLEKAFDAAYRSEEHTSELQSPMYLVCRLLLEKKKKENITIGSARDHRVE